MSPEPPISPHVMWHLVECGRYDADLPLWRELAAAAPDGVLDVGAGTGRVAIDLARDGHQVTALDLDAELLGVLEEAAREEGVAITTMVGDAAHFELPRPVGLIIVPMQTLQLLHGPQERAGFFASARAALVPGGRVAAAVATALEAFDGELALPAPDLGEVDGWRFISQPTAIRLEEGAAQIERFRQIVAPSGDRSSVQDAIRLAEVSAAELAEEAAAHGLEAEELRHVGETAEHVGSEVVIFRA